jgi:phytoene dehydrogenase-like protein
MVMASLHLIASRYLELVNTNGGSIKYLLCEYQSEPLFLLSANGIRSMANLQIDKPISMWIQCGVAGTVHLGGTLREIAKSEADVSRGRHPKKPFVLFAQPSRFDSSRAPAGKHVAWGYCHVPGGSQVDMTERIEAQVERFAPGFRDLILARHTMNTAEMEVYNANYVGGDINGGVIDARQLFTRPAWSFSPYRISEKGIYICSASMPPGGGVHGMCGHHAALQALKDLFPEQKNYENRNNETSTCTACGG